jgi:hypothetical protein
MQCYVFFFFFIKFWNKLIFLVNSFIEIVPVIDLTNHLLIQIFLDLNKIVKIMTTILNV